MIKPVQTERRKVKLPLVNGTNLAVTVELLDGVVAGEADSTGPLDAARGGLLGDLGSIELGHGSLLDERLTLLFETSSVVGQKTSSLDLHSNLSILVLHTLEGTNVLTELLALEEVRESGIEGALGKTQHLGSNTDTALVQDLNSILVALSDLSEDVASGDNNIVKVEGACRRGADSELGLLLVDLDSHRLVDDKASDTLVALLGGNVGKNEEDLGLARVGDPHLGAVEDVVVAVLDCAGLEGKGIRAGTGLGQAEASDGVGGEAGQVSLLDIIRGVLAEQGVDQGVLIRCRGALVLLLFFDMIPSDVQGA